MLRCCRALPQIQSSQPTGSVPCSGFPMCDHVCLSIRTGTHLCKWPSPSPGNSTTTQWALQFLPSVNHSINGVMCVPPLLKTLQGLPTASKKRKPITHLDGIPTGQMALLPPPEAHKGCSLYSECCSCQPHFLPGHRHLEPSLHGTSPVTATLFLEPSDDCVSLSDAQSPSPPPFKESCAFRSILHYLVLLLLGGLHC